MKNIKILYWSLIITFAILYIFIAISSTLHVIEFFNLANTVSLSILLAIAYEVAQSAILFSLLMTDNSKKILPWVLMIMVSCIQIIGNVYANFKFVDLHSSGTFMFFKRAILFWVDGDNQETYKILIAWIEGSILPIIALGLTALVANQISLSKKSSDNISEENSDNFIKNENDQLIPTIPEISKEEINLSSEPLQSTTDLDEEILEYTPEITTPIIPEVVKPQKTIKPPKIIDKKNKKKEVKYQENESNKKLEKILNKKPSIKQITNIEEINKPSLGEELMQDIVTKEKNNIEQINNIEDLQIEEDKVKNGVDIINVKVVPKKEDIGIPIKSRKNFDKIN
jgi:hypothetical protein